MDFIRLAISEPFLKTETSGLDQEILKKCAEHFTVFGIIKYISGHVIAH